MSKKVLLAHNELSFRLLAVPYLKKFDFEVNTAINGLDALHKVKNAKYDLVIVDWKMPVLDALGTLAQLSELPEWEKFHVIILLDENVPRDLAIDSEFVQILPKPFSMEMLHARVSNTLENKKDEYIHEPTKEEDAVRISEDNLYLELVKDMLEENSCLNKLIQFIHDMENSSTLQDLGENFYNIIQESLGSKVRLWMLQDDEPALLAEHPEEIPTSLLTQKIVEEIFKTKTQKLNDNNCFFYKEGFVLEVLEYPKTNKHIFQLLMSFLNNFIPVFKSFRDRVYFLRLKEQFDFANYLKDQIIENLQEIRESSIDFSNGVGEDMDDILCLVDQLNGDPNIIASVENITMNSMNRMQKADINNQKLFSIIGNLQNMFDAMLQNLANKDFFFNYSKQVNIQEVSSESILESDKQSNQQDIDNLLSDLGL